jgi:hypothetical protein
LDPEHGSRQHFLHNPLSFDRFLFSHILLSMPPHSPESNIPPQTIP